MDINELDETLKLFHGFHNNEEKRKNLLDSILKTKRISIFAYGSLLWNPIGYYDKFIPNCILNHYKKGFFCEDFIYRGTNCYSGLTMGLEYQPNHYVNGALFLSYENNLIQFLKSFIKRETPVSYQGIQMDIYQYDLVEVYVPILNQYEYSITCIVNKKSLFYCNNQLSIDQQAMKIGQAYGNNGTNFQYLNKLKFIYHKLNINDSFSSDFEILYEKILEFRFHLNINQQKWLDIYDQLQSLEENHQHEISLKNFFSNFHSSKQTNQLMDIEQTSSS